MPSRATLHLVVNPSSGRGRARRALPRVIRRLDQRPHCRLEVHETTSYDDARDHTLRVAAQAGPDDVLVVMGGDGMAHLGLNACAGTDLALAIIPAGTGNDFCRGAGLARSVAAAANAVVAGATRRIDLMRATDHTTGRRTWVGSVLSTGYDARVNLRTNHLPSRWAALGGLAYAGVALAELASFEPMAYRLVLDGEPRSLPGMFVAVGNAGYFGGGMHVCPTADVTDGLLDVAIVHPVSRATLLRLLPVIYAGRHADDPAVELVRCHSITVDGDDMFAMADGERLGGVPVTAQCVAGALRVVVP